MTTRFPPKHPIWGVLRMAIVGGVLVFMLHANYKSWDSRDILTVIATLSGLGGFDLAKGAVNLGKSEGE